MAHFKRTSVAAMYHPGGTITYHRNGSAGLQLHRVVLVRSNDEFHRLWRRQGNNPDLGEIIRWVKQPSLIGEFMWRTERTSSRGDLSIVFYLTQETTAAAMRLVWA